MNLKESAAISGVSLVEDGQVLGLGTGSTVYYALVELAKRIKEEGLEVLGIPTSNATEQLARDNGIPLTTLQEHPQVDLDIDGADQVSESLDIIKGGGGAHFREKAVALASKRFVVIVDESKLSQGLDMLIPVEALPFSWNLVEKELTAIGGNPVLRLSRDTPFVTDNGNYIIDVDFGEIADPKKLEGEINAIAGVLENGIFSGLACEVHVGAKSGVEILK
ncbi:MAG: ribose-5-phosphate isomerase RpiA [Candidatus Hydrothermarchaeales archaeon]